LPTTLSNVEVMPPRAGQIAPNQTLITALKREGVYGVMVIVRYLDGDTEVSWSSMDSAELAECALQAQTAVVSATSS
jgi:hypothetical protein